MSEYKLTRQGKIARGKLQATDSTNPVLIISLTNEGVKFIIIFPGMREKLIRVL